MSRFATPKGARASMTAFTYASDDAIVPVSPTPFAPIGLWGDGVTVDFASILGASRELGMRYSKKFDVSRFPVSSYTAASIMA